MRQRKLMYWLTHSDLWWDYTQKKWVEEPFGHASMIKKFYTNKSALKALDKCKKDAQVIRWLITNRGKFILKIWGKI